MKDNYYHSNNFIVCAATFIIKIIITYNIFIAPYSQRAIWRCISHVSR